MNATPGQLVIISGPSGVGKTTIVGQLLEQCPLPLVLSVSATTRSPRAGEIDGEDYHFLSHEEFQRRRENGKFLESCEVYGRGDWYGTLEDSVAASLEQGKWVILEIDVEGAMTVVEKNPEAITVFVRPESIEELERRLSARKTETQENIRQRLARAKHELHFADRYQHTVVNDKIDQTVSDICQILTQLQPPGA